jgi:hypothetical protein
MLDRRQFLPAKNPITLVIRVMKKQQPGDLAGRPEGNEMTKRVRVLGPKEAEAEALRAAIAALRASAKFRPEPPTWALGSERRERRERCRG